MDMLSLPITVILAVKNEAANLPKCLAALKQVQRVVVVDSQSTDSTSDIVDQYGAELVQFHYTGSHPKKRQWAIETVDIATPWVLLLDADEVVSDALWTEINVAMIQAAMFTQGLITKMPIVFLSTGKGINGMMAKPTCMANTT